MPAANRLACLALILLPAEDGVSLRTEYRVGRELVVKTTSTMTLEATFHDLFLRGEWRDVNMGGISSASTRRTRERLGVRKVSGGAPTRVQRTFLEAERLAEVVTGGRRSEARQASHLVKKVLDVELREGRVEARVLDGDPRKPSPALEGHGLELGLDALLPGEPVVEGAAWEIDSAAVQRAFGWNRTAPLFGAFPDRLGEVDYVHPGDLGSLEWCGIGTYRGITELRRVPVHEVELTFEAEGVPRGIATVRAMGGQAKAKADPPTGNTLSCSLRGRLWVSVEGRHPVRMELEGEVQLSYLNALHNADPAVTVGLRREGTLEIEVDVERP